MRRKQRRDPRAFIHDREKPPAARDLRIRGRNPIMMPRPPRRAQPLQPIRRTHHIIMRSRVALRVVEIVRPFIQALRHLLYRLLALHDRHAARHENPLNLLHRERAGVFRDQQIDHAIDIRQRFPIEALRRHIPVNPLPQKRTPRRRYARRIRIQNLDLRACIQLQRRGDLRIRTEPHDEAVLNPRIFKKRTSIGSRLCESGTGKSKRGESSWKDAHNVSKGIASSGSIRRQALRSLTRFGEG